MNSGPRCELQHTFTKNMALFQAFDLLIHNLHRLLDKVEFRVHLDFIVKNGMSFIKHTLFKVRALYFGTLLGKLQSISNYLIVIRETSVDK